MDAPVYSLTVFDADGDGPTAPALFVGGEFTIAGGDNAILVARWDGSAWSQVGPASDPGFGPAGSKVTSLIGFENAQGRFLYAGGDFLSGPAPGGGSTELNRLAKWNPVLDTWSAVGNGVDGESNIAVHTLAAFDDGTTGNSLFAGGSFETAGGQFDQQTGACMVDTGCTPAANIARLGCRCRLPWRYGCREYQVGNRDVDFGRTSQSQAHRHIRRKIRQPQNPTRRAESAPRRTNSTRPVPAQ